MSLIFHNFDSIETAHQEAVLIRNEHGLNASVHYDQESSDQVDPFPSKLNPPILLVDRSDKDDEIINLVSGEFAGT